MTTMSTATERIVPGTHRVTLALAELLGTTEKRTLTDEEIEQTAGMDCRPKPGSKGYTYLRSAQRRCEREYDRVWARQHGAGCLVWLDPSQTRVHVDRTRSHIGRVSKRGARQLAVHSLDSIPIAERASYLALVAQLGTLGQCATAATTRQLEQHGISAGLDFRKLLEALPKQK